MFSIKGFIHAIVENATEPFFTLYYNAKKTHPLDCVCFPFPMKYLPINCLCCHGCSQNKNPPFAQRVKGPWKVFLSDTFCKQYEDLCGKTALVDLLFDLEKHNAKADALKKEERKKKGER